MTNSGLPAGWQWASIGEVSQVIPGFAFKSKDWTDVGIQVVKIKNIQPDCTVSLANVDHVPHEILTSKLKKFILKDGDILLAMTGATAGKVGKLRIKGEALLNQRVAKLAPYKIDKEYFWAVVSSNEYQSRFFYLADGAAQPNMSGGQIENVEIPLPPLPTQRRIASILSAYDDLIENNTRRIAVLEEMARRIYEEWFVQFRFPGNEEASATGELPQGWVIKSLGDLAVETRDSVHPSQLPGDTPYVGLEHIPRRSITLNEWSTADSVASSKLLFKRGDILFGKIRPYFHKVVIAPLEGVCSTDTIVLRPKSQKYSALVLSCASSDAFVKHATQTSNGTKMPRADWKVLRDFPVAVPVGEVLDKFNDFIQDVVGQTRVLMFKNANLRAQRDLLLLPKLISGEIDVSSLPLPGAGNEAA